MVLLNLSLGFCLVLVASSFVKAQFEIRNNQLLDDGKVVPREEFDNVFMRRCHDEATAEWLLDNGVEAKGHSEVVKLLLENTRVDPSARNNQAIRLASENGHIEIVNLLLEHKRVDPSDWDNEALYLATDFGHSTVVKRLLEDGRVEPYSNYNHAIMSASKKGYAAIVELLLTNSTVNATKALETSLQKEYYGIVKIINKARPDLVIDENVLKLANKTIQVDTKFSVENSKLIVNYESEYEYDATFVLTSMKDDSTIYLNIETISNGKLSIEMSKLGDINDWNWRWICAVQSIESTGKFHISYSHLKIENEMANSSTIPNNDLDKKLDNGNSKISSSASDEVKLSTWCISFIAASVLALIAIIVSVVLIICFKSRRRHSGLAIGRPFGNGRLHVFQL